MDDLAITVYGYRAGYILILDIRGQKLHQFLLETTGTFSQEKNAQKERSSEWKRGGSRIRINIDDPQPSGPRNKGRKGWIFISFWSRGAFLVVRIFKLRVRRRQVTNEAKKQRRGLP